MSLLPLYEWEAMAYQEGIPLLLVPRRQVPPECWDVRVKSVSRIYYDLAKHEVSLIDPKAWPLLLDMQGHVAETHTSNVLIVKNNTIFTPRSNNILVSVARNVILKLAKEEGIECVETDLYPYDLENADEIFLTHTSTTIIPVNKFNHRATPKPVPGAITQQLLSAFSKLVGFDIVKRVVDYVQAKEGSNNL
jgi:branched-chain amino acid aminotransferase